MITNIHNDVTMSRFALTNFYLVIEPGAWLRGPWSLADFGHYFQEIVFDEDIEVAYEADDGNIEIEEVNIIRDNLHKRKADYNWLPYLTKECVEEIKSKIGEEINSTKTCPDYAYNRKHGT